MKSPRCFNQILGVSRPKCSFLPPITLTHIASRYDTGLKKPNKRIDVLDKLLSEQEFLVEGGFSLADVAVASYLLYVPQFFQGTDLSRWPNVVRYMRQCAEREAYGKAFGPNVQNYLVAACDGMMAGKGDDKKKLFGMFWVKTTILFWPIVGRYSLSIYSPLSSFASYFDHRWAKSRDKKVANVNIRMLYSNSENISAARYSLKFLILVSSSEVHGFHTERKRYTCDYHHSVASLKCSWHVEQVKNPFRSDHQSLWIHQRAGISALCPHSLISLSAIVACIDCPSNYLVNIIIRRGHTSDSHADVLWVLVVVLSTKLISSCDMLECSHLLSHSFNDFSIYLLNTKLEFAHVWYSCIVEWSCHIVN